MQLIRSDCWRNMMKVPEEIRKVERPANTVVLDRGPKYGEYRYIVQYRAVDKERKKAGERNIVLGYIINFKYVPFVPIEFSFSFGGGAFAHAVSADILEDLCAAFGDDDGQFLYALALVRAVKPALMPDRIAPFYTNSYVGKVFPDIELGEQSIRQRMENVKKRPIARYFKLRQERSGSVPGKNVSAVRAADSDLIAYTYTPDAWDLVTIDRTDSTDYCGQNSAADIALAMLLSFPAARFPAKAKDTVLFLDALSLSIILRMMKRADDAGVLKDLSYFEMIDLLNESCKDYKTESDNMLKNQNWSWLPTESVTIINALQFMESTINNRRRVPWRSKKKGESAIRG